MAAPTLEFIWIANSAVVEDLDTSGERLAYTGSGAVDDSGTPLDYGSVNIAGGAVNSEVRCLLVRVNSWEGNTVIENFRFFIDDGSTHWGFDQGATEVKWATAKLDPSSEWVQNPETDSYAYGNIPHSEPAQNVYEADGSSASITSGDDDSTEAIITYVAVASGETTGTYQGVTAGYEFRYSFKFDYS